VVVITEAKIAVLIIVTAVVVAAAPQVIPTAIVHAPPRL
jgi:hypothetical protein